MMIPARQIIEPIAARLVRPASHARAEIANVDAVFSHIEKNENERRTWICQFGLFEVKLVASRIEIRAAVPGAETTKIKIHGHRADTRHLLAVDERKRADRKSVV